MSSAPAQILARRPFLRDSKHDREHQGECLSSSTEKLLHTIRGGTNRTKDDRAAAQQPDAGPSVRNGNGNGTRKVRRGKGDISIGVDISPKGLRLLKLAIPESGPRLVGHWDVAYPEGITPDVPAFADFLSREIKKFKGSDRRAQVWSLVSSAQAEMWHVRVPKVPRSKLSDAVYWTAVKDKPFDPDEVVMDYEVQGEVMDQGVPKVQALVYTVPREVVDKAKQLFAAAGIKLAGLTISPIALQALFRSELVSGCDEVCANIYIGRNWSRIDLFAQGDLVLSRGVNTGVSSLVAEFADACNSTPSPLARKRPGPAASKQAPAPAEQADEPLVELVIEDGAPAGETRQQATPEDAPVVEIGDIAFELEEDDDGPEPEPVAPAEPEARPDPDALAEADDAPTLTEDQARVLMLGKLLGKTIPEDVPGAHLDAKEVVQLARGAIDRLVRQIERTFEHFMNTMGGQSVHKIFFSGDICTNRHFLDVLSSQLGVECALLDPLGKLAERPGAPRVRENQAKRLGFNLVCGLALCDKADTPNLLRTYKEKDQARRIIRQGNAVYAVFLVLAMACAGVWFWQHAQAQALRTELGAARTRLEALSPKLDETMLMSLAGDASAQQRRLKELSRKYEGLAAVLELGALTPEGVKLVSMNLELGPKPAAPGKDGARKTARTQPKVLVLDGVVQGVPDMFDATLATYLARLRHSPLFEAPVVHTREVQPLEGRGDVLHFILHITLT